MADLLGRSNELALFSDGQKAVIVDVNLNIVTQVGYHEDLVTSRGWSTTEDQTLQDVEALAEAAIKYMDGSITASGDSRLYTIPGGVQREAKKALDWRKEHKRGGTPVGMNTARTLAKGGQIGIQKVRHIAKYFPRHEVDKKGKGWDPGEDGYPSNGKIAWALWGGDAAWRWAGAIVEREDKKGTTAGGYSESYEVDYITEDFTPPYSADMNAFKMAHELDPYVGPEFMARIRLDNSGIDRLYKIDIDGQVYLWDGSGWDNMGHVDGDVYSYDRELDELGDLVEKTHVMIDPESAVVISAFLQERPFQPVMLSEIDPEESALMAEGLIEEDFSMIDRVMTAAGESTAPAKEEKGLTDGDGQFTPDERSKLAKSQPRDASGLFVKVGSRVVVAGDKARGSGVLESIDYQNNKVNVKLDSGKTIAVDSKFTEGEKDFDGPTQVPKPSAPLNLSGILGEPRTPASAKARVPGTLAPLDSGALKKLMNDWDSWVKDQRSSYVYKTDDDPAISKVTGGKMKTAPGLNEYDKKYIKDRYGEDKSTGKSDSTGGTPKKTSSSAGDASGGKSKGSAKSNKTETKFDNDGKYVVQKNDSLWSIAEKTKADGQSTEDQWLKILDANKDNLKSGNPDLIYPDERVNVPGQGSSGTKKTSRPAAQGAKKTSKSAAPSAQEKVRQVKQDEARKADESKKRQADAQEKIRQAKQDESRAAKPNAQEAMRQEKQKDSRAEAAKNKASETQDRLTRARNADRLDTTAKAKAKAQADARAGMQADKKAISDAEAAKNKASRTQDRLTDARNADRADTTARGRQAAEDKVKSGMQSDKKASSVAEAKAKAEAEAKSGVQKAKQAESSGITKTLDQRAKDETQRKLTEAKKSDQPVIKEAQASKVRQKFEEKKEFYRQQREKYGTYQERVKAAQERQNKNKPPRGT